MYRKTGRILASLLSVSMIWGSLAFAAAPVGAAGSNEQGTAIMSDTTGHWAKKAIDLWSARGIVNGVAEGKFEPDRPVTRSEWVSILNRIFQLQAGSNTEFKDVSEDKWFAADVSTAVYGEYIQGFPDGTFRPSASLTRAEAAASITRLLKLPVATSEAAFKDQNEIKAWSREAVNSVLEQGIITGYNDHTFQPNKALTRAEAVSLADRAVKYNGDWYGEAGTYGPTTGIEKVKGNVIINAPGVNLNNTEINGDLIIGKGVGSGDVYLNNIKVKGQVYIYGGGENSIHLQDSVVVKIIVDKKDGSVRLVAEGSSTVQEITINTGAILDVSQGVSVDRVSLSESLPAGSNVSLKGHFNTVNVEAYSISLKIPSGSVKELNVAKQAGGSTIDTSKETTILSLVLDAAAKVIGLGSIQNSVVNAPGVSFEIKPDNLTLGSNVPADLTVSIGGAPAATISPKATSTLLPTATPVPVQYGNGVGGGGSESTPVPTAVPTEGSTPTPVPTDTPTSEPTPTPVVEQSPIKLEKKYIGVGEAVYFTSDYEYDVYLVSSRVYYLKDTLELAVQSGEGIKLHVKAGERNYFDTSIFKNVSFPENYEFRIFAYDGDLYSAFAEVMILNESEPLRSRAVIYTHMADPEYFSMNYNRRVYLAEGQSLEGIVQFREKTGEYQTFNAALGKVELVGNVIYIKPVAGLLEHGKSYDFKLIAGAVSTATGEKNEEFESHNHTRTTKLTLLSPSIPEGQYEVKIKAGDILTLKIDAPGTVYLVPAGTIGNQTDFDKLVNDHWGLKKEIDASKVNQSVELDTSGLPTGRYTLQAWYGTSVQVVIEE